jgi:HAD superfamily hydrolase (TIGR01662 family)
MIKVILFDLGNTLIYFDATWSEVLQRAIHNLVEQLTVQNYNLDKEQFAKEFYRRIQAYYLQRDKEFIEHTTEYVLSELLSEVGYKDVTPGELRPALDAMYAVSQAHWKREEDTIPTLEYLTKQGYRLGLISNAGDAADVHTLVDNARLRPFFEQIIISATVGIRKPHAQIFELTLDLFKVSPQKAVMVGDTLEADILGANNLGMRSIWVTRRVSHSNNHNNSMIAQPTASVNQLSEIPAILASWG